MIIVGGIKMIQKEKTKIIISIISVVILLTSILAITYINKNKFEINAEEALYYGFIETNASTAEKLEDFAYLYEVLEKNYPFLKVNKRLNGVDWLKNKTKYEEIIKNTNNDAEFFVAIHLILNNLNNDHVAILSGEQFEWFSKLYHEIYYQYNAVEKLNSFEFLTDSKVLNRYKFDDYIQEDVKLNEESNLETIVLIKDELAYIKIKSMASSIVLDQDYEKMKEFLKDIDDYEKLIIDIRGNRGGVDKYWENLVQLLIDEPLAVTYYSFFKDGDREKDDPFRVQGISAITDLDEKVLGILPQEIKEDFGFYNNYSIRLNPWSISPNPLEQINFMGKIYLLVDRDVFSSAEKFASFAKDTGFATLVGETTGGDRVFEQIPIISLPNTGFAIRYSRELSLNADGTINMESKTIPHIQVNSMSTDDYNKDECIQAVIKD